jgi:hypothetical protein
MTHPCSQLDFANTLARNYLSKTGKEIKIDSETKKSLSDWISTLLAAGYGNA